jgi:thiol-disulfide isomerase/thioredoxin
MNPIRRPVFTGLLFLAASAFGSAVAPAQIPNGRPAPEFPKDLKWDSPDGKPVTLASLKGRVVIIDFWDYTCINCIRTFPHLKQWYDRYHDAGLDIIGVHKGEFKFAADADNVAKAYARLKLPYPNIIDSDDKVWDLYKVDAWPESYLVDRNGLIRLNHQGEGRYAEYEKDIQTLLKQGHPDLDFSKLAIDDDKPLGGPDAGSMSPETYIGTARAEWSGGKIANREGLQPGKTVDYAPTTNREVHGFFVQGPWINQPDDFESAAATTDAKPVILGIDYVGREVYGVFDRGSEKPAVLYVTRDGKPIPADQRGKDIQTDDKGQTFITVDEPRMYYVIAKEDDQSHELTFIAQSAGARICSFTFGNKATQDFDRL